MKKMRFSITILFIVLSSCVSLGNNMVTNDLPKDLVNRNYYPYTSIMKYKLEEMPGTILYQMNDGTYKMGKRILKDNYEVKKEIIDNGKLYHFYIDNSASTDVKQNIVGSLNIATNQKMEMSISDVFISYINYDDIDLNRLVDEFSKPIAEKVSKRMFIQGVLLSTVRKNIFTKQKGGLVVKVDGIGAGFDGDVYSSNGIEGL